ALIQPLFELILQLTLENILMSVLPEPYTTDMLNGLAVIYGDGGVPACVTVTVAEVPPPLIVTLPVRAFALVLAWQDTPASSQPFPEPDALIQLSFGLTLQLTLEDTSIV
ncbi:MAG: hypothetical protein ABR936_13775, partial [Bacteroidota bacterium]